MTGQFTQFGANRAVQAGVGKSQSAAAGMYLALATAQAALPDTATLADFNANEITTAGYARQAVTWGSPSGDPSEIANDVAAVFGAFGGACPEVTHFFLCDVVSGTTGNVLAYWTLEIPRSAGIGQSLAVAAGDLTMSVD